MLSEKFFHYKTCANLHILVINHLKVQSYKNTDPQKGKKKKNSHPYMN